MKATRFLLMLCTATVLSSSILHSQWVQTNGPYGGNIRSFAVSGTNLFAGTNGGVFLSTNNGTSWTAASTGLPNAGVNALAVSGTNLFAGTDRGDVFLSTNNGTRWTAVSTGLTSTYVHALAVSGTNLFAGTAGGGVFLSTNNGTSWTAVNTGLTNTRVNSLAVSGTNLFAGTWGGGVFLSTNNGTSWTAVNTGLTKTDLYALAVSGTNLFAGTWGGGVFLSTNNGTSWTQASTGLTDTGVLSLAVSGTNLFAGTDRGGVFLSTNNGTSWTAASTGLTNTEVRALAVSGTNLFAGTWVRRLIERLNVARTERISLADRLCLSDPDLYDQFLNTRLQKAVAENKYNPEIYKVRTWTRDPNRVYHSNDQTQIQSIRAEWVANIANLGSTIQKCTNSIADLKSDLETLPHTIQRISEQLREIRLTKSKLYATVKSQSPAVVNRIADSAPTLQSARRPKQPTEMTAEDLRNAYFETFILPTELGRFLGQLDRNKLAFALTGDSGAGKSYLAFEIAKLFSDEGYRTKIFCLEEGIGQLTQDKVNKYDLSNDVIISGTATLSDVRKAASQFDLIVLDSFSKLDVDATEFENLRTDFPRTVFLIVFQKTSTGSIRGGASVIFNSAATIDITQNGHDRIASMVKGRYGTQGWRYSIDTKQIQAMGD